MPQANHKARRGTALQTSREPHLGGGDERGSAELIAQVKRPRVVLSRATSGIVPLCAHLSLLP